MSTRKTTENHTVMKSTKNQVVMKKNEIARAKTATSAVTARRSSRW